MTLEQYRLQCRWSINQLARKAELDFTTTKKALTGGSISRNTANKLASAISEGLGKPIRIEDIEGLNVSTL